ncbi:hypothetical protein LRH25_02595 [Ideonella azotifigens]|uniref:hypothetical protein n=1 Tax=Ideonella azotifigens TaxID=513160 RepID=UPI0031E40620|nr:hypothetical protein [Ideonella azotifigens]
MAPLLLMAAACAVATGALAAGSYRFTALAPITGASQSFGVALNDLGVAAGTSDSGEGGGPNGATVWLRGVPTALLSLGGPGAYSSAQGINNLGQVVGDSTTTEGPGHATRWTGGTPVDLGTLGGGHYSIALAINHRGQVVGYSDVLVGGLSTTHAALWQGTTVTDLGTLGGSYSSARSINRWGQVVGSSTGPGNASVRAVLWQAGSLTDLGSGYALCINDAGQVVGTDGQVATLWSDGVQTSLGTLGGSLSSAAGINNAGLIVGNSLLAGDVTGHAAMWQGGVAVDLNTLLDDATRAAGWVLLDANGVNERGAIIGTAYNSVTGEQRGYVLRPLGN